MIGFGERPTETVQAMRALARVVGLLLVLIACAAAQQARDPADMSAPGSRRCSSD
jgi:hypothetical protein